MNNINNSPNFTGTYIKSVNVLKNNLPEKASLIELSKKDLFNIERVSERWDTKISGLIAKSFYFPLPGAKNPKVYAVSTQTKDFEKLNPSKVLGMFEVTDRGECYALEYLDVNPKYKHNPDGTRKVKRGFSQVGRACIDYIRTRFRAKEIELVPVEEAIPFYEKMGCVKAPKDGVNSRMIIV